MKRVEAVIGTRAAVLGRVSGVRRSHGVNMMGYFQATANVLTSSCSLNYSVVSADVTHPKSTGELLVVVVVLCTQQLKEPEHAVSF